MELGQIGFSKWQVEIIEKFLVKETSDLCTIADHILFDIDVTKKNFNSEINTLTMILLELVDRPITVESKIIAREVIARLSSVEESWLHYAPKYVAYALLSGRNLSTSSIRTSVLPVGYQYRAGRAGNFNI